MTKIDWFKRHFNFISSESILQLQEKYPFKGFYIYELAMSLVCSDNEYSIKFDSTKYSFLIKSISIHTDLPKQEIIEIFNFLIETSIIIKENDDLIFPEIKKSHDDFDSNLKKKSEAGKKGASNRWNKEKQNKLQNELPQFEGTFNHIQDNKKTDVIEKPNNEITDSKGNVFSKLLDIPKTKNKEVFEKHFTYFFEFIPESTYIKARNKQEQKAFIYITNMFLDGDMDVLSEPDEYLEDVMIQACNKSPDFYISNVYTRIVNDFINVRNNARNDIIDQQAEKFCEKYRPLKEMQEIYYQ